MLQYSLLSQDKFNKKIKFWTWLEGNQIDIACVWLLMYLMSQFTISKVS